MRNRGEGARRWRQNDVLGLEKRGIRVKKSIVDVIINFDTEKINISRALKQVLDRDEWPQ